MTREGAVAIMIAAAVAILAALALGWRLRTRRDRGLRAPFGEPPVGAVAAHWFPALYVATTRHDEPLERLAIKGLAFRAKAELIVADSGLVIDLAGQPRIHVPAERIASVGQSTVAIDRVVEKDGLVRVTWRIDDATLVDSYFRPQDASARALADAIAPLTTTGTDA